MNIEDVARVCHAQEAMIQAALEPLGVAGPPWDNEAVEDAADMILDLRAERDALKSDCARISAELGIPPTMAPAPGYISTLVATNTALSARVEALTRAGEDVRDCLNGFSGLIGYAPDCDEKIHAWDTIASITPDADLAAHDERVKREVCDAIIANIREATNSRDYVTQVYILAGIEPSAETPKEKL